MDAEETDKKYEKHKQGNKQKAKYCKKKMKKKANIILSDNSEGESEKEEEEEDDFLFTLDSDFEGDDSAKEEKEETKANYTPKSKSNIGEIGIKNWNQELKFRAKNTVFNKSQLTGW